MRRWPYRAQSSFLRQWLHALLPETLSNGSTQKLQTLAGTSIAKRSAGGRWLCTAALTPCAGEDTFVLPDEKLEGMSVGSFTSFDKRFWDAEPSRPMQTEPGSDDPLVEAQSRTIRNIVNAGVWDSDMQERLRPFLDVLSTTLVARVLNQVTAVETAQAFFNWVAKHDGYKHNSYVYNALVIKLGLARAFEDIWKLLKRMKAERCDVTSTTFALIIQAYGKAGKVEGCWRTMDKAEGYGIKPDVRMHTALLRVLFDTQKVVKAKQLIHRMEDQKLEFDLTTWFTIIQGLCKNKMPADAQKFLDRMLLSGCSPNAHIFNAMIVGFCETGDQKKALSCLDLMRTHGCNPDTYTYNALIHLYCGLHLFVEAEGLVSDMKNAGCEPDHVTFNTLLQYFEQKGDVKEAEDLFNKMEKSGLVDGCSYRIYSSLLRKSREVSKLMSLSDRLYSRYCSVDSEVCNAILQDYCEAGDLNKATKYLDETFYRLSAPNGFSFALLINGFCKSKDVDAAMTLLSTMGERGCEATSMHYDLVINALCNHLRGSEAVQLIREMNAKGLQTSSAVCDRLLKVLSNAGLVKEVFFLCTLVRCRKHTVRASTVLQFMKCFGEVNQFGLAEVLFLDMRQAGCFPQTRGFRCCASYLLEGKFTEVEKFLGKNIPNPIQHTLLLQSACNNKKVDAAKAILSEMKELGFEPSSGCYSKLIYRLSRSEETAMDSLELLEEVLEKGVPIVEAIPSYLMDYFCRGKQLEVISRFCGMVIAKRLILRKGSASGLLQQENESELKKLYFELEKSGCLVDSVPSYNSGELKTMSSFEGVSDGLS